MIMKIRTSSGRNNNSTKPLSCDSSSTFQFGEVQPLLCMEMEADSSVKAYLRSIVRLGVLNVPTFGRMKYKVDARFIPFADIYRPYENLISQQMFSTGDRNYVPTSVPVMSIGAISAILLSKADCTLYRENPERPDEFVLLRGSGADPRTDSSFNTIFNYFVRAFYRDELGEGELFDFLPDRQYFSQYSINEYIPRPGQGSGSYTSSLKWIQVSPAAADFMYKVDVSGEEDNNTYLLCFRLNNDARRLYKILTGCGWQFDLSSRDNISILPFVAFFKGYFDLYRPLTTADGPFTYDQTPAHRLMEQIVHYNVIDCSRAGASDDFDIKPYVDAFFTDLMVSTYFEDTDFITSHISKPALSNAAIKPVMSSPDSLESSISSTAGAAAGEMPSANGIGNNSSNMSKYTDTAWNVKLLLKLLPYINKNTVVGGNIEKYLKAHGLGDFLQNSKSFAAGSYELPCRVSDIDSVADTYNESTEEGDLLGAYTGKGLGITDDKNPGNFSYKTNVPGYFIMFGTMVPLSRVSQGVNPMLFHRSKLEFYDSAFDALDYQISRKSLVCGRREIDEASFDSSDPSSKESPAEVSFGFIPRYSEYCYLPNILNGGLSLRSNRSSFISYTLDKYYDNVSQYIKPLNETDFQVDLSVGYVVPVATPQLRNISNPLNGNFNRIFAQSQIVAGFGSRTTELDWYNYEDDKFVIHNAIDVLYSSAKKPLSISFETNDGGSEMEIDKE